MVDMEVECGSLIRLLPEKESPSYTMYLVHPQTVLQNARLRAFIEFTVAWIRKNLAGYPLVGV